MQYFKDAQNQLDFLLFDMKANLPRHMRKKLHMKALRKLLFCSHAFLCTLLMQHSQWTQSDDKLLYGRQFLMNRLLMVGCKNIHNISHQRFK